MQKLTAPLGFLGTLAVLGASAAADDTADLRLKFQKGRVTYYRQTWRVVQKYVAGEQSNGADVTQETGIRLTVKDVLPDGSADVDYTILYARFHGRTHQHLMKFDSRRPKARGTVPILRGLGDIVGLPFTIRVAADGGIQQITGLEKLKSAIPFMLKEMVSEDTLRKDQRLRAPGRETIQPVEVGGKWQATFSEEVSAGKFVGTTNYTLESIDSQSQAAEITAETILRLEQRENAPISVILKEGKMSSHAVWDIAKGELVRSRGTQKTIMAQGAPMNEAAYMPDTLQEVEVVFERITLDDMDLPTTTKADDKTGSKSSGEKAGAKDQDKPKDKRTDK